MNNVTAQRHVADWERVSRTKGYSNRVAREDQLISQWMGHEWSTVIFGLLVQGKLKQVDYACDVVFTLVVEHGNKTLHIEGPFEEFLPVKGEA